MMAAYNPKIMLAGSVNSSKKTLQKLIDHDMNIVGVLGLDPSVSQNVSGYVDLKDLATSNNLNFRYFKKINSDDVVRFVRDSQPDYLFVVGLSQLVKEPLLSIPVAGCIGFHPTKLPEGRGRAAVAWLILGKARGAATFFVMSEGMDDGPILVQKEFEVTDEDYAGDVINKIISEVGSGLDELLPQIKNGTAKAVEQDHTQASYLGIRNPEDGIIIWENSAEDIVRLVRAVADPLPGAFTYIEGQQIMVDRASVEKELNYIGVVGRILKKDGTKGVLVQSGSGLVWIESFRGISFDQLKVGQQFGSFAHVNVGISNGEIEKLSKSNE